MIAPNSRTVKESQESAILSSSEDQLEFKLRKWIAKENEPGISNAKPDFTFGIMANFHPDIDSERFSQRTRALIGVVPYITHPFLIIEAKSNRYNIVDTENQALRGGSIIVRAQRLLNGYASGWKVTSGADHDSFVFLVTIDSRVATTWLHWCEVRMREWKAGGGKDIGKGKELRREMTRRTIEKSSMRRIT
ncbi:MAG: hypothetical protein Q9226_007986 [Calogaya cf. arnoldii]